jgi:hypothetical protein
VGYLSELLSQSEHVIIVGDFNLPDINWSSLTGVSPFSKRFCEFIFDSNLIQLVENPTHMKGNILDLVLTTTNNVRDLVVDTSNYSITSDHYVVSFKIEFSMLTNNTRQVPYVFDYKHADMDGLLEYMLNCDFSECLQSDNIEFVWAYIKSCIYCAINLYIPKVKRRWLKYPCWFTSEIKHHLNCLRTLKRRTTAHPTVCNQSKLKSSMKHLQDKIISAKTSYETQLIKTFASNNNSKFFKYINSITGNNTIPPVVNFESSTALTDYEKATLFNFHSVFTQSSFVLPPSDELPTPEASLSNIVISESDVFTALTSLDPSKAMGIDCVGPKILTKMCTCTLPTCSPLILFESSQPLYS